MRQNSLRFLAPAGTASRSACSRWPVRGRLWEWKKRGLWCAPWQAAAKWRRRNGAR